MKSRKPVALETIPVSRSPGQYLLQSMVDAVLDDMMARIINTMLNTGCLNRYTVIKQAAADTNAIKMVRSIFLRSRS